MSLRLLKCLLIKEFYDKYKHKLSPELFIADNNAKNLYSTLSRGYEAITKDLTVDSLKELHYTYNPALSTSNKHVLEEIFTSLKNLDITKETGEVILKQAIEQQLWTQLGSVALDGGIGLSSDVATAQDLLDEIKTGANIERQVVAVTDSIDELLSETAHQQRWTFPLPPLQERLKGIGPTTFTLLAARPNVGKTGVLSAFIAQPEGFLAQKAHVLYLGNEESARRTKLRMQVSWTGITELEMREGRNDEAQEEWNKVKEYLHVLDVAGYSVEELEQYIKEERHPIDILAIDVLDKLHIRGNYAEDETRRLAYLYMSFRERLKKYDIAGIGTSQANAEADGKTIFGMECLANSRTGKGGELDVCLCLGYKRPEDGKDSGFRTINIAKNKLSGTEDYFTFNMNFKTTRAIP